MTRQLNIPISFAVSRGARERHGSWKRDTRSASCCEDCGGEICDELSAFLYWGVRNRRVARRLGRGCRLTQLRWHSLLEIASIEFMCQWKERATYEIPEVLTPQL